MGRKDCWSGLVLRTVGMCVALSVVLFAGGVARGGEVASAVIGTYAQTPVMVADGTTVYTAWVYADNRPLAGEPTWGVQFDFLLPAYATLIPGGLGVAYGQPSADRDFFQGNPMAVNTLSPPGLVTGRLVQPTHLVSNHIGDLQFFNFTIDPGAPLGAGSFDVGALTAFTDASSLPQAYVEVHIPFTVTALAGDFDNDGFVGIADLNSVLGNWNAFTPPPGAQPGDANGDGFVGIEDLNWVLGNWNAGTPPAGAASIPEPGVALWAVGALGVVRRKDRFSHR